MSCAHIWIKLSTMRELKLNQIECERGAQRWSTRPGHNQMMDGLYPLLDQISAESVYGDESSSAWLQYEENDQYVRF